MGTRNDDISLKLAKAVKQGFLPDVADNEVDILTLEARQMFGSDIAIRSRPTKGKIVALGTSIAAAVGASSSANAYPAKIAVNLSAQTGQDIFEVVAAGVSGDRTNQMLTRLPDLLRTHAPEYVTIEVSVNDTRTDINPIVSNADTTNNLQQMIDMVKDFGATPILIGSAPFDYAWWGQAAYSSTSPMKAYDNNTNAKAQAITNKIMYVDLFSVLLGRIGVLYDGLHPNDTGHNIWAKAIAEAIRLNILSNGQTIQASDSFNRSDSSTSLGNAEVGGAWVQAGFGTGAWGISANKAYVAPTTSVYAIATVTSPSANISIKVKNGTNYIGMGIAARVVDSNNYYVAEISNSRTVNLWKRVAGTFTAIITVSNAIPAWSATAGDELIFNLEGSHLSIYAAGRPVLAITDTTFASAGSVGLWNAGNSPQIDSFFVTT